MDATEARRELIDLRNLVVVANLGLVHRIARKFVGKGLGYDDLVQCGAIGLIRAVELFDPAKGCKLSTYSTPWITRNVLLGLGEAVPFIRLPAPSRKDVNAYCRAEGVLIAATGHPVTFAEVADAMGLSPGRRRTLAAAVTARRRLWHLAPTDRLDRIPVRPEPEPMEDD